MLRTGPPTDTELPESPTLRTPVLTGRDRLRCLSKKLENHQAAIALQVAYYNFCRIRQSLSVTPAMEAGITDHGWSIEEFARRIGLSRLLFCENDTHGKMRSVSPGVYG